jgi:hypothetical protein
VCGFLFLFFFSVVDFWAIVSFFLIFFSFLGTELAAFTKISLFLGLELAP